MSRFSNGILLESAIDRISRQLGVGTERLIGCLAKFTSETRSIQPFDTGVIPDFDALGQLTFCNDDAGAFMAAHEWVGLEWEWPVAIQSVQVSVADTAVFDIDEDFIGARLWDWDLFVGGWSTLLFDDLGPLLVGDGRHFDFGDGDLMYGGSRRENK